MVQFNINNLILSTDSYKLGHYSQYPAGTTGVYSYLEARVGARFDEIVFVGLQPLLRQLTKPVTMDDVNEAATLAAAHFGRDDVFNREGWEYIVTQHHGRVPVRIKALPEGTIVRPGVPLITVENTDPKCFWLTNALESSLTHVWYPTTVASLSLAVKRKISKYLDLTAETQDGLPFMLHDFGYRGATTHDAAAIGGLGHLVNFMGTDTLPAMLLAVNEYKADLASLAFSVNATEHSVMTALGAAGERAQTQRLLDGNPTGIISCVGDSYNIYKFAEQLGLHFKPQILARDGKFVLRPDSITPEDPTPEALVVSLLDILGRDFGYTTNAKGFKVLNPKVGLLWGDGIDIDGIEKILADMMLNGWSAENIVFGMGGGLLQKVNRDTLRFAFKSSAQQRNNGAWTDVQKNPLDQTKKSKAGRLKVLIGDNGQHFAAREHEFEQFPDRLEVVFDSGYMIRLHTFEEIRNRAA